MCACILEISLKKCNPRLPVLIKHFMKKEVAYNKWAHQLFLPSHHLFIIILSGKPFSGLFCQNKLFDLLERFGNLFEWSRRNNLWWAFLMTLKACLSIQPICVPNTWLMGVKLGNLCSARGQYCSSGCFSGTIRLLWYLLMVWDLIVIAYESNNSLI